MELGPRAYMEKPIQLRLKRRAGETDSNLDGTSSYRMSKRTQDSKRPITNAPRKEKILTEDQEEVSY